MNLNAQPSCCFTGHRVVPEAQRALVTASTRQIVERLIVDDGCRRFIFGGAVGYDTLAAQVVMRLRYDTYHDLHLTLAVPFDGFTSCWTDDQRRLYARLLPYYDDVVCVSDRASREAYLARDRWMVERSGVCVAYCTRSSGGTAYTVRYAREQGVSVLMVV